VGTSSTIPEKLIHTANVSAPGLSTCCDIYVRTVRNRYVWSFANVLESENTADKDEVNCYLDYFVRHNGTLIKYNLCLRPGHPQSLTEICFHAEEARKHTISSHQKCK